MELKHLRSEGGRVWVVRVELKHFRSEGGRVWVVRVELYLS